MEYHQRHPSIDRDRIFLDETRGSLAHHVDQGQETQNQIKRDKATTDGNAVTPGKFAQLLKNTAQHRHNKGFNREKSGSSSFEPNQFLGTFA